MWSQEVGVRIYYNKLDKTLRLWDLNTMTTKEIFTGHTKDVLAVSFSPDNRMIFSGGMDKTLRFWNTVGENKHINTQFNGWVSCLNHIRKGKDNLLAVGAWDSKVRIFDTDLTYNRAIDGLDYGVVSINSDDEGEFMFVGQKNGVVKIWSLANDTNEVDTLKQTMDVNADLNAFNFDSTYFQIITLATAKGIQFREIKGNSLFFQESYGKNVGCLSLAYDPSKKYMFAGFTDGKIRVFKMDKAEI
jgi:guanine nucleotide-binding protein subunit beta-2-like 1 protein